MSVTVSLSLASWHPYYNGEILTPKTSIGISSTSISDFDIQNGPGNYHLLPFAVVTTVTALSLTVLASSCLRNSLGHHIRHHFDRCHYRPCGLLISVRYSRRILCFPLHPAASQHCLAQGHIRYTQTSLLYSLSLSVMHRSNDVRTKMTTRCVGRGRRS